MTLWEYILGILPDSLIHIEEENTTVNIVNTGGGHSLTAVEEGEDGLDVLSLDFESLSREEQTELVERVWEEQGELFIDESDEEIKAIESAVDEPDIEETLDFYDQTLDDRRILMLKAALILREAWVGEDREISRVEMRDRKRDIAERYGGEAPVVCNLATAGYFDEGGYIRELFEDMMRQDETTQTEFIDLFDEIVSSQPFSVFVGQYDSTTGVIENVKRRIRRQDQYGLNVEFIDIRGIGSDNRAKIRRVIDQLEEEADNFRSEEVSDRPDLVVRLYLEEISGLVE